MPEGIDIVQIKDGPFLMNERRMQIKCPFMNIIANPVDGISSSWYLAVKNRTVLPAAAKRCAG